MAKPIPDLEEIFSTATNKQSGERTAYLEEVCGHDPALRQRIEQFLSAQAKLGSFLEVPAAARVSAGNWRKWTWIVK